MLRKKDRQKRKGREVRRKKGVPFCAICPNVGANFPRYTKALEILEHGGHKLAIVAFWHHLPFHPSRSPPSHEHSRLLVHSAVCSFLCAPLGGTIEHENRRETNTNEHQKRSHVPRGSHYFMSLVTRVYPYTLSDPPDSDSTSWQTSNETRRQKQRPEGDAAGRMVYYEYVWKFKRLM